MGHFYQTPLRSRFRKHLGKGGRKNVRAEDVEDYSEMLPPCHDIAITLMNSQQLQSPIQHQTREKFQHRWGDALQVLPLTEEPVPVDKLCGEERTILF